MKLLALMKYGDQAASTRQRLMQFGRHFDDANIDVIIIPLLTNEYVKSISLGMRLNWLLVMRCYFSRLRTVLFSNEYDAIWVHCESFPYLPSLFERLVFLSGKPVIYDFDDAIFHQYDSHRSGFIRFFLGRKLVPLLNGASLVICGNRYLQSYADKFCDRTQVIPTVVDTTAYVKRPGPDVVKKVTIGWIGSPSTWIYVKPFTEMLSQLAEEEDLIIRIVGAGPQSNHIPRFQFINWTEKTEIGDVQAMDIGIMPLPDEVWAKGKCGYKLIQYMACGIPVVASPVGVNSEIVDHGVDGLLAVDLEEWKRHLLTLVRNPDLRAEMGGRGRIKIEKKYSLKHYGPILAQLIQDVVNNEPAIKKPD